MEYTPSTFGKFNVTHYVAYSNVDKRGVEFRLEFKPTVLARGAVVGLIQVCRSVQTIAGNWVRYYTGHDAAGRTDFYGDWFVDNGGEETPMFKLAQDYTSNNIERFQEPAPNNQAGKYTSTHSIKLAKMTDEPKRTWQAPRQIEHQFETVAMAITDGANPNVMPKGTVLGSIFWGYKVSAAGIVALDAVRVQAGASFTWSETRKKWNAVRRVKIPQPR
jgi:hypothetical protein